MSTRSSSAGARARVVVIGGGFAGTTAAKYIRLRDPTIEVTLVERDAEFVSCPLSNLVIGGSRDLASLTRSYGALSQRHGVRRVRDEVTAIDTAARRVRLARGADLRYDRLIVAPGVDVSYESLPGLSGVGARQRVLHAWRAGPQTLALRRQLEAMPDGGVFAIHIPKAPYRCPPGPYERACQVAWYLRQHKPRSKVLVLDANDDIVSKKALFRAAWDTLTPGIVEYRPSQDAKLAFGDQRADVLNVIPPQRAGAIAHLAGLVTANDRWCGVDFRTFESLVVPGVHVLGDATLAAPLMPKSGHMANQHAKVCADAVVALLSGESPNPEPIISNTCYSFVSDRQAVHVASVHRYDPNSRTFTVVDGTLGVSPGLNDREGAFAEAWANNIWADMLG
ncbi:MAG: NAD(P)/FAD-dependent oxidoreductase [Betaproteobacteria bacterium]|nr:NAD(P)/FAD-dependent oxidoreductase [Betaproteobacteria bacterium]